MSADVIPHPTFGNAVVHNIARPGRKAGVVSLAVKRRQSRASGDDPRAAASEAPANTPTDAERVHAGLLEGLEEVLEQARAGHITGAVYVFQGTGKRGGEIGLFGTCCDDMQFTLSHSARLVHYVNLLLDEHRWRPRGERP